MNYLKPLAGLRLTAIRDLEPGRLFLHTDRNTGERRLCVRVLPANQNRLAAYVPLEGSRAFAYEQLDGESAQTGVIDVTPDGGSGILAILSDSAGHPNLVDVPGALAVTAGGAFIVCRFGSHMNREIYVSLSMWGTQDYLYGASLFSDWGLAGGEDGSRIVYMNHVEQQS